MKTARDILTLWYVTREKVGAGVYEDSAPKELKVRATRQAVFQDRVDRAQAEGMVITGRFTIREDLQGMTLKYAEWHGAKYKLRSAVPDVRAHRTVIELGELL